MITLKLWKYSELHDDCMEDFTVNQPEQQYNVVNEVEFLAAINHYLGTNITDLETAITNEEWYGGNSSTLHIVDGFKHFRLIVKEDVQ